MARTRKQLLLRIEQGGAVTLHKLLANESVSVGRHPGNDVTVYGEAYPKKHILFAGKKSHFQVNLKGFMQGEVVSREARLSFRDMILHDLLARKGDSFVYAIGVGKKGVVHFGDTKIVFQCEEVSAAAVKAARVEKFAGFSWVRATFRDLGNDLPFKVVLLFFVILNTFFVRYLTGLPTSPRTNVDLARVPERLARIIVRNPEPATIERARVNAGGQAEDQAAGESEESSEAVERSRRNRRPEAQGVLGLLTGIGASSQSNNLADFLLDKGLARELDEAISSTDLSVGRGNGSGDDFDELFALGDSDTGGGIDDLLQDVGGGDGISLGEKGQIQVDRIGGMRGNQAALGQRSEESVRAVMLSYTGRLTYIYNKYLKIEAGLNGKLVVEVEIAANGSVARAKLVSSSVNHPEFEQEVLSFVRRWKYDAIEQGTVTVTYPLFFSKVG